MVNRELRSLVIFLSILIFPSCTEFVEEYADEPYYLSMGDTLYFTHSASYSDSDQGGSSDFDVSVFEDPGFGLSIYNTVYKLNLIRLNETTVQLTPVQTGETTLIVKSKYTFTCNSCIDGPTITYKYYTVVISP